MVNPFPLARHRGAGRGMRITTRWSRSPGSAAAGIGRRWWTRAPRCIPDERFDELFAQLGSHRDRALVAFWVSTGARASELLGATVGDVDPGQQLITVIRKGTRVLQPLPAAPDAFVWLRLYQAQLAGLVPAGRDEPLWWTLRRPFRALSYDAARAMFTRANAALGANWSLHDLRHTAAYRMARDPQMPLTDVQWVLGHAHLSTTQRYLNPVTEDVIAECWPSTPGDATATRRRRRRRGTAPRACRSCSARTSRDRRAARRWRRPVAASPVSGSVKSDRGAAAGRVPAPADRRRRGRRPRRAGPRCWPGCWPRRSRWTTRQPADRRLGVLAVLSWLRDPARRQLAATVAGQRRGGPARLAAAGRHRPRRAAAAPEPRAAGADLRRCDPARPGLAAALRPGAARPGRRDGPHPRSGGVRRARRAVPRAGSDCRAGSRR